MCRFEHYFRLFCNISAKTWRILSETGIILAKPPQCAVSCFEKVFIFSLAFQLFPCYSISAGRGGLRSFCLSGSVMIPGRTDGSRHPRRMPDCPPRAAVQRHIRYFRRLRLLHKTFSALRVRGRERSGRSDRERGPISLVPRTQREPERSCTVDRGRCAIQDEAGLSSPLPGSCASLCLAVFPGFSIRRLSLTFKTGSFPGEPVIGESPIGVSIVRGLGRRDKASDSCAVHFSFCYNQQRSSAPGCAARGAVTFLFV